MDYPTITNDYASFQNSQVSHKLSPIYYNISVTAGYTQLTSSTRSNIAAEINELNNQPIVMNASQWYMSIIRSTIPTNYVPLLIVPIVNGLTQTDLNKTLYTITFQYVDGAGVNVGLPQTTHVEFIPETSNTSPVGTGLYAYPKPPSENQGKQDTTNYYYWVWSQFQFQFFYQKSLIKAWQDFCVYLVGLGISISVDWYPVLTYDINSQIWSLNYPAKIFEQRGIGFERVDMFVDALTIDTLSIPSVIVPRYFRNPSTTPSYTLDQQYKMVVYNNFQNLNIYTNTEVNTDYLTMTAGQSNNNMWGGLVKIIFSVSYGLSTKLEYDSLGANYGQSTNQQSAQKPLYQFLGDLEVDRDSFSKNKNFIQFNNGGSITQSRLVELNEGVIQSFQIAVKWVDTFGNINPITIPDGLPLTVKLGFFPKSTCLL